MDRSGAERQRTPATKGEGSLAMEPWHPFRSTESKHEYLAFYDARAQRWPIASESMMVSTTFGDTFVRVQGPADGPPLVLLPGDSETSLSWIPVIEAFASEHRVYAIDHINDIGRSIYRKEPRRPDDFVQLAGRALRRTPTPRRPTRRALLRRLDGSPLRSRVSGTPRQTRPAFSAG